ncbi:MAG: polyprenyl synthetase family protein [Acidimicrobiales bacterium]
MIRTVPEVLGRVRDAVEPALREAVSRLTPGLQRPVAYHLGWTTPDGTPSPNNGGKGIRSALAVLSAEAADAPASVGVPGAVAVELVHNFSLLHDDVIDNDTERRHRPTVWSLFGVGKAIIAGDAMLTLAQQVLLDPPSPPRVWAASALADATAAIIAGQDDDMTFEQRSCVSVEECLAMEGRKTGALLACSAAIGTILADGSDELVEALTAFGMHLGWSFQAVDDLLGIWGDPSVTGKPVWSDLRSGKKTLPIALALANGNGHSEELASLVGAPRSSEAEVERVALLVEACGGRELTADQARHHFDSAVSALDRVTLAPGPRCELHELAAFVCERTY